MTYAVIDIGSNTIRLSAYLINKDTFKTLFHKKSTAGLASYISKGKMSEEGIKRACEVLQDYKNLIECIKVDRTIVFGTASIRNTSNTFEIVEKIHRQVGYEIEVLSGEEEAYLGYRGILGHTVTEEGVLIDIGGGSTELSVFTEDGTQFSQSYPIGSLNIRLECVKGILPTKDDVHTMKDMVRRMLPVKKILPYVPSGSMVAIGGTARAICRIAPRVLETDIIDNILTIDQMKEMLRILVSGKTHVIETVLESCPDRIHTLIPGLTILYAAARSLNIETIEICPYGIREGYLFKNILQA